MAESIREVLDSILTGKEVKTMEQKAKKRTNPNGQEYAAPKFKVGRVQVSEKALKAIGGHPYGYVMQHASSENWLEIGDGENCKIATQHTLKNGTRLWIVTTADRSVTRVLLNEEF